MGNWVSHGRNPAEDGHGDSPSPVVAIRTVSQWNTQLESHKNSNQLMVIDFKATWCGPCRAIAPAFKALAAKYADVVFLQIDVDELPQISQQWNVNAMPTFLLLKGGNEVGRVVGARKDELESKISLHLQA